MGALLLLVSLASGAAPFTADVAHVLDGDSFVLADGRQVRVIGINAPELGRRCPGRDAAAENGSDCQPVPEQALARAARERLAALIEGRRVRLVPEGETHDRHRRLLAHVEVAGTDAGETLVREGLAWMVAIPPNVGRLKALQAAEGEARAAARGVWREPRLAAVDAGRLAAAPTGFHLVKGEIRAVRRGRRNHYFELAPQVVLVVSHRDWEENFAAALDAPDALAHRRIVVRGWVSERRGERRLQIAHPAMLTFAD
jgi:endonuclease YncB( thermonuclease family)